MRSHTRRSIYELDDPRQSHHPPKRGQQIFKSNKLPTRRQYTESFTLKPTPRKRRVKQQRHDTNFDLADRIRLPLSDLSTIAAATPAVVGTDDMCKLDSDLALHSNTNSDSTNLADVTPSRPSRSAVSHQPQERHTTYENWNTLIPTLARALVNWRARREGEPQFTQTSISASSQCAGPHCKDAERYRLMKLVSINDLQHRSIHTCAHHPLPIALIDLGFFPSAPMEPEYGFALDLCSLFTQLFRAPVASIRAMAGALHRHHRFNGIVLRHADGAPIQAGYRKPLQHALQWYDVCLLAIDCSISTKLFGRDNTLGISDINPAHAFVPALAELDTQISASLHHSDPPSAHWIQALEARGCSTSQPTTVDQALVERCPSCFNTNHFEPDFARGGDVHIAVDGNFNQKHCESAGDCPAISARSFNFVPRWWTDAVDAALEAAGRKPTPYTGTVPEATVVACENSHKAGRGDQKAAGAEHDDKGLIALVCRHNIPLLLCNVDTPGERQKYAVGLILWLLLRVPSAMKIVVLYDIACVTARTLNTRNILMPGMLEQLNFATAAMHAYAHQWTCQVVFNPRMITGMGLTDGEGVERLWSLLVDLIGILRKVSRSRRIVILERQIQWIADCLREELGRWGRRRAGAVEEKRTAASRDLATCGYDTKTLRSLWEEQRQSQLSIREATKPLLKQDMKTIHDLQETVDALDDKIDRAEISLTRGARNAKIKCGLVELRNQRDQLVERIESLYMSLNIADNFPHIKSLGNEFVQLLVQTYNTKALLRARVVGRIFEFHFLDRAVGGRDIPLGYKQNQQRRQQLKRGTPVIERLRDRYNGLVEQLHDIAKKKKIDFPLPVSLPPNILSLRDDPALMEDVWLGASENNTPLWLTDPKARIGIRAMQLLDRCDEESARLNRELAQLADWLAHHWERVQLAKEDDSHGRYAPWLRDETLQLEDLAFGCGIKNFGRWAQSRLGGPDRWLAPSVHSSPTFLDISQPGTSNSRVFGDVEEDESDRGSDCDDLEGQRDVADDLATFLSQLSH